MALTKREELIDRQSDLEAQLDQHGPRMVTMREKIKNLSPRAKIGGVVGIVVFGLILSAAITLTTITGGIAGFVLLGLLVAVAVAAIAIGVRSFLEEKHNTKYDALNSELLAVGTELNRLNYVELEADITAHMEEERAAAPRGFFELAVSAATQKIEQMAEDLCERVQP